jgi:hypothetical protein
VYIGNENPSNKVDAGETNLGGGKWAVIF